MEPASFPSFDVDLDLPPRQRWVHIAKANFEMMKELAGAYQEAVVHEFGAAAPVASFLSGLMKLPAEYMEELEGFAEAGGIRVGLLLRLNVGYDFVAKCTSAVVRIDSTCYHLRNMDWSLEALRKMSLSVRFMRSGKPLHTSIVWLGFIGSYTGLATGGSGSGSGGGAYSVSMNFRKTGTNLAVHLMRGLVNKKLPIGLVVRQALERHPTCEGFVREMLGAQLMAPCYLTVCGGERGGVVLTLGRNAEQPCRFMDTSSGATSPFTPCFVAQTNHDPWITQPGNKYYVQNWTKWAEGDPLLLNTRERYDVTMANLQRVVAGNVAKGTVAGGEAAVAALGEVLRAPPTNNYQTLFGVIMMPSENRIVRVI